MNDSLKKQVLDLVNQAVQRTSDAHADAAKEHQLLRDVKRMIEGGRFTREVTGSGDFQQTICYTVPK
jgi:hypothetical protein